LKNLRELIEAGGVEALVQAAGERAMRCEREFWLPVLERYKLPEGADIFDQLTLQIYIASVRRKLGIKPDADTIRAQTRERVRKHRQLDPRLRFKKLKRRAEDPEAARTNFADGHGSLRGYNTPIPRLPKFPSDGDNPGESVFLFSILLYAMPSRNGQTAPDLSYSYLSI
jgi:hypothetical protein